jgi:uncharacterized membrane protein
MLSVAGGTALAVSGLRRGGLLGMAMLLAGGALAWRGAAHQGWLGRSTEIGARRRGTRPDRAIRIEKSVTINRPREDLYRYWRNFENLPQIMTHLESVRQVSDRVSHWVARAPGGGTVEWDAELTEERENERLAWQSLENADVPNSGSVTFRDGPGGRGTELHVTLTYEPPMGALGRTVASLLGEEPEQQVEDDLRNFKQSMETGEVATNNGLSTGDGLPTGRG